MWVVVGCGGGGLEVSQIKINSIHNARRKSGQRYIQASRLGRICPGMHRGGLPLSDFGLGAIGCAGCRQSLAPYCPHDEFIQNPVHGISIQGYMSAKRGKDNRQNNGRRQEDTGTRGRTGNVAKELEMRWDEEGKRQRKWREDNL